MSRLLDAVRMPLRVTKPLVRDAAAEVLFRSGVTRPARANRRALTIATFHRVLKQEELADYPIPEIAMTEDEFAWFIAYFAREYDCVTLSAALARLQQGEPQRPLLAVTFDDGQLDNFRVARPVLARYGVPATFFVTGVGSRDNAVLWHDLSAYAVATLHRKGDARADALLATLADGLRIDDPATAKRTAAALKAWPTERRDAFIAELVALAGEPVRPAWDGMMSVEQLRALATEGHEIGCHTFSHAILPLCDDAQLEAEVRGARAYLQQQVGGDIATFCYPNGDWDDRTEVAVRDAGFTAAVTTRFAINPLPVNAIRLSRCDMQGSTARNALGQMSEARVCLRLSGIQNRMRAL